MLLGTSCIAHAGLAAVSVHCCPAAAPGLQCNRCGPSLGADVERVLGPMWNESWGRCGTSLGGDVERVLGSMWTEFCPDCLQWGFRVAGDLCGDDEYGLKLLCPLGSEGLPCGGMEDDGIAVRGWGLEVVGLWLWVWHVNHKKVRGMGSEACRA